jgi:hypothetical protein
MILGIVLILRTRAQRYSQGPFQFVMGHAKLSGFLPNDVMI